MNRYRFTNSNNYFSRPQHAASNENEVAERFKEYIIRQFNVNNETVTKLEKARVKQLYFSQFPRESQTIEFMQIMTKLKYEDKVCDEINGYLLWGPPELVVNYLLSNDIGFVKHTNNFLSRFQHFCHSCSMGFENGRGWKQHIHGRKHQMNQFKIMIMKYDRSDLVRDKSEVLVTSSPLCDLAGNVNVKVALKNEATIPFYMKIVDENFCSYTINPLYESKQFEFSDSAVKEKGLLRHDLIFRASEQFGHHFYPVFFKFDNFKHQKSIHILRLVNIDVIGELHEKLVVKEEYKKKELLYIPDTVVTVPGVKLPKIKNCSLEMSEIDVDREFSMPNDYRQLFASKTAADVNIKKVLNDKSDSITAENYVKYFKFLLYAEEYQLDKDIRYYDMKQVKFDDSTHNVYLHLNVPNCIENRPAVIIGDRVYIYKDEARKKRYEAIVHDIINGSTLKLGVDNSIAYIKGSKYDIEFSYDKTPFKLMHRALDACEKNFKAYKEILFPSSANRVHIKTEAKAIKMWFDRDLNDEQKKAVSNILAGTSYPAPFILFGPPGTGKTISLVEAIKQIWRLDETSYIVACASNNLAADILAERLVKHVEKSSILRLYNRTRQFSQVPAAIVAISNFDNVKKEVFFPSATKLQSYRIIICSLVTYGRVLAHSDFNAKHVTHLFIDEAAQSTEAEILLPIVHLVESSKSLKIVLAGDPQQLGSIVHSPIAKQYGLDRSLLERLIMKNDMYCDRSEYLSKSYNEHNCVKLLNNYRSHRAIIEIPKKMFYDGILNECAGDFRNLFLTLNWPQLPNKNFPCIFHPVYGREDREGDSPSYFNIAEIETINKYLSELLDNKVRDKKMKFLRSSQIGIITPYRGQSQKIKEIIKEKQYGDDILVGSPEEFQGQERCVIIISAVRSFNSISANERKLKLGFLNNPKRFNVAITRAQALLIVIANPFMLKADPCWETFLKYLKENKAWVNTATMSNMNAKTTSEYQELTNLFDQIKISKGDDDDNDELSGISETTLKEHLEWTKYD